MARFYADEDFPLLVVKELRRLGHDVLTVREAGRAGQRVGDADVLADATSLNRAVLTHNHPDFSRLHRTGQSHSGVISCTQDPQDPVGLAHRIHSAVAPVTDLTNQFLRVTRPNVSTKP